MKQDKFSNYGALATQGSASMRRIPKKFPKGKAGLAIAGLAAAGGLGVAGVKALKNRESKTIKGRVRKAQNQVASKINSSTVAKKMGVKVSRMK